MSKKYFFSPCLPFLTALLVNIASAQEKKTAEPSNRYNSSMKLLLD